MFRIFVRFPDGYLTQYSPNPLLKGAECGLELSWVNPYKQKIGLLHQQLFRLNTNTFLLQKIVTFPFLLLDCPIFPFWWSTTIALVESSILLIWKLSVDNRKTGLTLQQFQEEISSHIRDSQIKEQFDENLKLNEYSERTTAFRRRIMELRHQYIAHLNVEAYLNPTQKQIQETTVRALELKECQDVLNAFFESLLFGIQRSLLLPSEYNPEIQTSGFGKTDIERLLDDTASHSAILNLPETNARHWDLYKKNLRESDLEILNRYRARLNLPPA